MKVLIVEDETLAAERLEDLIHQHDESIEVMECIDSVKESVAYLQVHHKDVELIFLDIQLADGKSFEIFDQLQFYTPVIFTTAYDEYTLNAFKLNSIDYLLKPISFEALQSAFKKFDQLKNREGLPIVDKQLLKDIISHNFKSYKQRFLVKFGKRMQFKNAEDIAYIYAEDKICHIVESNSGKQFIIDHTLEELDTELLDPKQFYRINRQYILNINAIREVREYHNNRLEAIISVACDEKLIVSRNKVKGFKMWLNA